MRPKSFPIVVKDTGDRRSRPSITRTVIRQKGERRCKMANIITCIRIVLSIALLFCPALSPAFCLLYTAAGFSDMLDGHVARKTGTAGKTGAKLDTIADIVFTAACLIKLLPVLDIPVWLYIWISIIAIIKLINIAIGYVRQKEFVSVHSATNKAVGGLLFLFPLTLAFIDLKYSAAVVCAAATAAAVYEGYLIYAGRTTDTVSLLKNRFKNRSGTPRVG